MNGFTLIELLMTLSVGAILSLVAVPSMTQLIKANALTVTSNGILGDIQRARALALQHSSIAEVRIDNENQLWELCVHDDDYGCVRGEFKSSQSVESYSVSHNQELPPLRFGPQGQLLQVKGDPSPLGYIKLNDSYIHQSRCIHILATGNAYIDRCSGGMQN